MINKFLLTLVGFTALTGTSFATLVPIGSIPSTGNGLGAVNTVVTFQNTGTESGCVGFIGGATVTGSTACNTGVTGSVGGNEQTGAGNNVYTAANLGITSGGPLSFANVVLIFNGSEPQNAADAGINLTNLSLNLFANNGTNSILSFTAPSQSYTAFPGTGNAGFAYQLDAPQAAAANAFLASNPNLRIGASATATQAAGGLETVSISTISTIQGGGGGGQGGVPEPATYLLMSGGFLVLAKLRKSSFFIR